MRAGRRTGQRAAVIGSASNGQVSGIQIPQILSNLPIIASLRDAGRHELDGFDAIFVLPLGLGLGALLYLAAPEEPDLVVPLLLAVVLAIGAVLARSRRWPLVVMLALSATAAGFVAGKVRTLLVAAPVIEARMMANVQGLVLQVDQQDRGRMRVTLRPLAIDGLPKEKLPRLVRISARRAAIHPGDCVEVRAMLQPPPASAVPGGFDFSIDAFFSGIGAVGFATGRMVAGSPVQVASAEGFAIALDRMRNGLVDRIVATIGGEAGAVTASLVAGKRGLISDETNDELRASGLYHVISISGLHMAIFAGGVFSLLRLLLASSPSVAVRWPTKRIAALASLGLAGLYAVFAGLGVATVRSFLMTALVLGAAAWRRRAVTRRNLALAAAGILALAPEAIVDPGFQMSFAAVALLVAWADRPRKPPTGPPSLAMRAGRLVLDLGIITVIATLATAPYAAFHFHRLTLQAIAANLVATPLISTIVMPLALFALVLEPFGYGAPAWRLTGHAVDLFLMIASEVASWPGASVFVPQFPAWGLAAFSGAIILLSILQTRLALLAAAPVLAGLLAVVVAERPLAIIGAGGRAVLTRDGNLLSLKAEARDRFVAREWLLAMGDGREPDDPTLGAGVQCDSQGCTMPLNGGRRLAVVRTMNAVEEDCGRVAILVTPRPAPDRCRAAGLVVDGPSLKQPVVIQVFEAGDAFRLEESRPLGLNRPWGRNLGPDDVPTAIGGTSGIVPATKNPPR